MNFRSVTPDKNLALFVKKILLFEGKSRHTQTVLPFFADGYPGLMFQESDNGLLVSPYNKQMPSLFLYGQTIRPIELVIQGRYKLVVFQLYPFVLKSFFNLTAKDLNDTCYDMAQLENTSAEIRQLEKISKSDERIGIMSQLLIRQFNVRKENLDLPIREALGIIIANKGQVSVWEICKKIHLTERTFERRFVNSAGITPKQFSQIIRFQQSFQQLTMKEYTKLSDLVYHNGFADQSHFIRVFKAFTGRSPKSFASKS